MMVTPCRVTRAGESVLDEETGTWSPSEDLVYDGRCDISAGNTLVVDVDGGAISADLQRTVIKFPVSAGPFKVGDVIRVAGRTFKVDGLHNETWQKSQRLPTVEVL